MSDLPDDIVHMDDDAMPGGCDWYVVTIDNRITAYIRETAADRDEVTAAVARTVHRIRADAKILRDHARQAQRVSTLGNRRRPDGRRRR